MVNMTTTTKRDAYEEITARILTALDEGTVPWRQPWTGNGLPMSMSTNKPYRGVNVLVLNLTAQAKGWDSAWFGTYKNIEALGGQVRRGEKSTPVVFWKTFSRKGKPGERVNKDGEVTIPMIRLYNVFNYCQADNLPERFGPSATIEHDVIADAEKVVADYFGTDGAPSLNIGGDAAFYRPSTDSVHVPEMGRFATAEGRYATLFHEMGHSTGHASRLARTGVTEGHRFGDEDYSIEELVAEMTSAMLCGQVGIDSAILPMNAAYIASWMRSIRNAPKMLVQAAGQAQKAADAILGVTWAADATTEAEAA